MSHKIWKLKFYFHRTCTSVFDASIKNPSISLWFSPDSVESTIAATTLDRSRTFDASFSLSTNQYDTNGGGESRAVPRRSSRLIVSNAIVEQWLRTQVPGIPHGIRHSNLILRCRTNILQRFNSKLSGGHALATLRPTGRLVSFVNENKWMK